MKKLLCVLLAVMMALSMAVVASAESETADYSIAVITGTISQSVDERGAAMALQAKYGEDVVKLATYPDNFTEEKETTIQTIVNFADDPSVKAIVVCQAVPGTAEAFRQVKERRDDIICIAGETQEDWELITDAADLLVMNNMVARGYLIIKMAKDLGCDTFVHISFPRHLGIESLSRRLAIMKEAGKDLGVNVVEETAADPLSDVGVPGAQAYILEHAPEWIEKYGQNSAYFCTNDAHTDPLLKQLIEYGGYFINADLPSPLMGYPGALGIEFTDAEMNDADYLLETVEKAIVEKGGAGRFGLWKYGWTYTLVAALGEHALRVVAGEAEVADMDDLDDSFNVAAPGSEWNEVYFTDVNTGVKVENYIMMYEDTYIMGDPGYYVGSTDEEVPEKYFSIK